MEQQLKYEEWFFQSDYDLETAHQLLQSGRSVYCIFMCHLSLEKALKGLFIKRLNEFPPKLHDLMYFVDRISLPLENTHLNFLMWLNRMAIITRYPEDLQNMIKLFSEEQTNNVYKQAKTVQQWIMQQ
ncbi:MAG: HEPN domain-containing protein [Candidatus Azobacteroides sp.]|nr:HEPN domain-containing protein [Candidatus Azobacteroides sp.]